MSHPLWEYDTSNDPPVFDIYVSDFLANQKKTKMLFVSAEWSMQEQIITFFKKLYDGKMKEYPQGSMMLFIPLTESTHYSPEYHAKILFNHDKFNGEEAAVCIGGLQNLKMVIGPQGTSMCRRNIHVSRWRLFSDHANLTFFTVLSILKAKSN